LGVDVGGARDFRVELAVDDGDAAVEGGAGDAFLAPDLAGFQLAIGVEAGQFRAGAGAARRAVVGFTGAEDEVLAVGAFHGGVAKEFDVIDHAAIVAGDAVGLEALADAPRKIGEFIDAFECDLLSVAAAQEEPVAGPGDVSVDPADARRLHRDVRGAAVAGDVAQGHSAIGVQVRVDVAHHGLQADAGAALDAAHVFQGGQQADGAVAAHAQVADVVEEDHAGVVGGAGRLAQQRAHDGVVAARLIHGGRAEAVEPGAEAGQALGDGAVAQVGAARDDDARGFSAGVRINNLDALSVHSLPSL